MADIIDAANDLRDAEIEHILAARPKSEIPKGNGACLCCGEPLTLDQRWCDSECRDMYLKHNPERKAATLTRGHPNALRLR